MARSHAARQSNHIQVAYADDSESADRALAVKAASALLLGIDVHLCGSDASGIDLGAALAAL